MTPGTASLLRNHILPFTLLVTLLGVATVIGDYLLHRLDRHSRHLADHRLADLFPAQAESHHVGERQILAQHARDRHLAGFLDGALHAGVHFNAILPWLATLAMGVNIISGMVGKMLLKRSCEHVQARREQYQLRGMSKAEVEQTVFWESVTFDAMIQWRKVHIPIFIAFAVLALGHIISIFLFWGGDEKDPQVHSGGQPDRPGHPGLCLSPFDGRPRQADSRPQQTRNRLFCLPRSAIRGHDGTLQYLSQACRDRQADEPWVADPETTHQHTVPSKARQAGLPCLPQ